ncbi:glycosyltransferase, partial [Yersinia nurmii]
MCKLVSICIPSLNRSVYLLESLKSIYGQEDHDLNFEVCISNNASNEDYSEVETYIKKTQETYHNINYVVQEKRIPLDEHHHFVNEMAKGDYIYFLGDDDCFFSDSFKNISLLLKENDVDLAIFNGVKIDKIGNYVGKHFSLKPKVYEDFAHAFLELKDKSSFGAILVKKKYLSDENFKLLYGSSHAFCCFWLSLMNYNKWDFNIVIPSFDCIKLRRIEKNYSRSSVFYEDVIFYINTLYNNVLSDEGRNLIEIFKREHHETIYSIPFMSYV